MMRRVAALVFATAILSACSAVGLFQPYEYEEDVYLSLDGTATVYVNASVAALDALRGASFDTNPRVVPDRAAVRQFFEAPSVHDVRVTTSLQGGRRFVHVRVDVDDVRRMSSAAPFSWSSYRFGRDGELFVFQQTVGRSAGRDVGDVGWTGNEVVAFRLHLPSKIEYHNAGPSNPRRGNILAWEQPMADRLRGEPVVIDARIETRSILYRTLFLFAGTLVAVAIMFALLIWRILKRGTESGMPGIPERAASSTEIGRRTAAR
jgi:hypothetical protein